MSNILNKKEQICVRFAPSSTGGLHIGGIRTALFNYIFAKQNNGKFLLRIEDTDQKRFDTNSETHIFDSLEWLGITPDESPYHGNTDIKYRQSEREYKSHIQYLIDNGYAYYAFDTDEELSHARNIWDARKHRGGYNHQVRMGMNNSLVLPTNVVADLLTSDTPYVIRFKMPVNETISFTDGVRGVVSFNTSTLDDKVLMKSNGIPTYHGANVVDDYLMGITHIIRGEEWLPSTPLHILLYKAFGWNIPAFYHLPLILDKKGKKFSKRTAIKEGLSIFALDWTGFDEESQEVKTLQGYKEMGFEPNAFLNYLVLLGWHPTGDKSEILSVEDMIEEFDLDKVISAGAKFDLDKLKSINATWLSLISTEETIAAMEVDFLGTKSGGNIIKEYNDDELYVIAGLAKERAVYRKDLIDTGKLFFGDFTELYGRGTEQWDIIEAKWDDTANEIYKEFISIMMTASDDDIVWNGDSIKQVLTELTTAKGLKIGKTLAALRLAIAGGYSGPDLMISCEVLGKEEALRRIFYLIK
jgi:glutamyl-tRNA synthetase